MAIDAQLGLRVMWFANVWDFRYTTKEKRAKAESRKVRKVILSFVVGDDLVQRLR